MGCFHLGASVIHVLELPSGRERFALTNPAPVSSAVLSPDGESLAAGC